MEGEIPSPTGDRRRAVSLWIDERGVPSLEFGGWHTHASSWDEDPEVALQEMFGFLGKILRDRVVLVNWPRKPDEWPWRVIPLDDEPDEILDYLTMRDGPAVLDLWSWSGAGDRKVTLADLSLPDTRPTSG